MQHHAIRVLLIGLVFLGMSPEAKADFVFNARLAKGFDAAARMELGLAEQLVAAEKAENPGNSLVVLLDDYIDFYRLILNENQSRFESREKLVSGRIKRVMADKQESPWKHHIVADIELHWTVLHAARRNYVSAILALNKAKKSVQYNEEHFPNFLLQNKTKGLLDLAFGSVPDQYKWMTEGIGFKGDLQMGIRRFKKLVDELPASEYRCFATESRLFYGYILIAIKEEKALAWSNFYHPGNDLSKNLLACFFIANNARLVGQNDIAIELLKNRPQSASYIDLPYFDYALGSLLGYKSDPKAATFLLTYLKQQEFQEFKKDAALRLMWLYKLEGNTEAAEQARAWVKKLGNTAAEKDKQALREAELRTDRNLVLLKARILYEGGYFESAEKILEGVKAETLEKDDRIEFFYRLARSKHDQGKTFESLQPYTECVKLASNDGNHLPANACLQLGLIYEKRKDWERSRFYFNKCLSYDKHSYTLAIHNKAKAGLKRLPGA